MIKSFFSSILRAFANSIGKFIFWALLGLAIAYFTGALFIQNCFALDGWGGYLNSKGTLFSHTSLSSNANLTYPTPITVDNSIYSAEQFKTGTATTYYISENVQKIIKNHYYSYSQLICSNSNITNFGNNLDVFFNMSNTNPTFNKAKNIIPISTKVNNSSVYSYCYNYQIEFNTKDTLSSGENMIISMRYNNGGSNKNIYVWGSQLIDHGISNTYLESIAGDLQTINNNVGKINNNDVKNQLNNIENNIIENQNNNNQQIINNNNSNKQEIIDNQNKNTSNQISNENKNHEEAEKTRKGILGKVQEIVNAVIGLPGILINKLLDLLKSLFIPNNLDFLNNWIDALENKLGFIAEIPLKVLKFILDLANWEPNEINSIKFPKIKIMGHYWWNEQMIDLSQAKKIIDTFKYGTDFLLVILVVNSLFKIWENFTGGGN